MRTRKILGAIALLCLRVSCSSASTPGDQESLASSKAAITPNQNRVSVVYDGDSPNVGHVGSSGSDDHWTARGVDWCQFGRRHCH